MTAPAHTPEQWSGALRLSAGAVAEFHEFAEARWPDARTRPPLREIATEVFVLGLRQAEDAIKPEPSMLDRLRVAARQTVR